MKEEEIVALNKKNSVHAIENGSKVLTKEELEKEQNKELVEKYS